MASTASSAPPNLKRAVDRDHETESVFDWLRRQRRADRKPTPPRGITQAAPKKNAPSNAAATAAEGNTKN